MKCWSRSRTGAKLVWRNVTPSACGPAVVLNLTTGVYFGLDPVGTRIWQLFAEREVLADIAHAIVHEYDVTEDRCAEDLLTLIADLMRHSTQKKYEYRHKWRLGDWVLWDNRSVMHQANPDYDMNERRYLYRLMLKGETPV